MAELSPARRGDTAATASPFNGTSSLQRITTANSSSINCYIPSNGGGSGSSSVVVVGGGGGVPTFGIQRQNKSQCFAIQSDEQLDGRSIGSRDVIAAVRNHSLASTVMASAAVLRFPDEGIHSSPTSNIELDGNNQLIRHVPPAFQDLDGHTLTRTPQMPIELLRNCSRPMQVTSSDAAISRKRMRSRSSSSSSSKGASNRSDIDDETDDLTAGVAVPENAVLSLRDTGDAVVYNQHCVETTRPGGSSPDGSSTVGQFIADASTRQPIVTAATAVNFAADSIKPISFQKHQYVDASRSSPLPSASDDVTMLPSPSPSRPSNQQRDNETPYSSVLCDITTMTSRQIETPKIDVDSTSLYRQLFQTKLEVQSNSVDGHRSPSEVPTQPGKSSDALNSGVWQKVNGILSKQQEGNVNDADDDDVSGSSDDEMNSYVTEEPSNLDADDQRRRYLAVMSAVAAASDQRVDAPQLSTGSSIIPPLVSTSPQASMMALPSVSYAGGGPQPTGGPMMFRSADDMLGFAAGDGSPAVGNVLAMSSGMLSQQQHHQQQQSSSSAGGGPQMTSRNSCKTLKCPKCNWHYKYQETLEIHMREKHPEADAACAYCTGGGAHPRLARGESYTCGYKPYRCDVCNYSTTTKGNLSIHLQSDKHTNNVQELQQNAGGGCTPTTASSGQQQIAALGAMNMSSGTPPSTPSSSGCCLPLLVGGSGGVSGVGQRGKHQQAMCGSEAASTGATMAVTTAGGGGGVKASKPSWRCDFCGYETTEARNLRIHMTSEKHAHNMLALQQSAAAVSVAHQMALYGSDAACASAAVAAAASLFGLGGNHGSGGTAQQSTQSGGPVMTSSGSSPFDQFIAGFLPPSSSAASAISSLGMQCVQGSAPSASGTVDAPMDLTKNPDGSQSGTIVYDRQSASMFGTSVDVDDSPCLFRCTICDVYATDSLDALQAHIQLDRSSKPQPNGSDQPPGVAVFAGGNYLCTLCQYRTSLKANFQLHCKTDKHLQRLQLVNHVQEGCLDGSTAGWDRPLPASAVEVRCAACDYRTNSVYRLQMHAASPSHVARATLFRFLCAAEVTVMLVAGARGVQNGGRLSMVRPKHYRCLACGVNARSRLSLIEHAQSSQHVQNETAHLQTVPGAESADYFRLLSSIFVVDTDSSANENVSGQ